MEELLETSAKDATVLDPFSGTATTALCAARRGHEALALDVNPFLVWFGNAKLRRYQRATLAGASTAAEEIAENLQSATPADPPPIHRIERWWSPRVLDGLCRVRAGILAMPTGAPRDLLTISFARSMMALSNAAFDHQSMSFGAAPPEVDHEAIGARFLADTQAVLDAAAENPLRRGQVAHGDARDLRALGDADVDLVITSPPYPNRMSYVRELRPYMYWTGFLTEAREAGELDWRAIGGTWGVATSRLADWSPDGAVRRPSPLPSLVRKIRDAHPKNGPLLAAYVDRYFEDTARHLLALRPRVRSGGSVHYIVGNSTFYGVEVPVQRLYASLLRRAGFSRVEIVQIRKRNSKKELYEYRVSARG